MGSSVAAEIGPRAVRPLSRKIEYCVFGIDINHYRLLYIRHLPASREIRFAQDSKAIGIEILAPEKRTLTIFNRVLRELGFPPPKRADPAPPSKPSESGGAVFVSHMEASSFWAAPSNVCHATTIQKMLIR